MTTIDVRATRQLSFADRAALRLAAALVRWTERSAQLPAISHEEMSRLRATEAAMQQRPVVWPLLP